MAINTTKKYSDNRLYLSLGITIADKTLRKVLTFKGIKVIPIFKVYFNNIKFRSKIYYIGY